MKPKLNIISKGALLLSLSTVSLFGKNQNEDNSCNSDCCPEKDPCANCAQLWPSCGPDWIITPNAGPCVASPSNFFLTGEFLYWTIRQDQMAFAFLNESPDVATGLTTSTTKQGVVIHPDWETRPAFRVGLGYMGCHDGWDVNVNYTWLRVRGTKERIVTPTNDDRIISDMGWVTQATSTPELCFLSIEEMQGTWKQNLDIIDFELGRNFFISSCLYLRPNFGFKLLWKKQTMDVTANGLLDNSSVAVDMRAFSDNEIFGWGLGIRAGIDSAWHFTRCFSLIGEVAVSSIWEKYTTTIKEYNERLDTSLFTVYNNVKNKSHTMKPILELYVGIRFEDWACCDCYHYGLDIGWEEQWWASENLFFASATRVPVQNDSIRSRLIESRLGDLFMQGLTIKLRFDF